MRRRLAVSALAAVATFVFGLFISAPAAAQSTYTWSSGTSSAWATPASWTLTTGTGTAPPVSGDTAIFAGPTGITVTLATDAVNTVNVSGSGSWTWATGTLTLDSGVSAGAFNYGSSATSTFSGTLAGGGAMNVTAGTLIMSGTSSYTGLTTVNGGTLTLSGTNTAMTGGVTLTSGNLNINSASALGTGTFTINGGAFSNTSGAAVTLTANNVQSWTAGFTFGGNNTLNLGTGSVTLVNSLNATINGAPVITTSTVMVNGSPLTVAGAINMSATPLIVGGAIGGSGKAFTVSGAGTLILTGANTYTGGTILTTGSSLIVGNGATGSLPTASAPITLPSGAILGFVINSTGVALPWNQISGGGALFYQGNNSSTSLGTARSTLGLTTSFTGTLTVSQARVDASTTASTSIGGTSLLNLLPNSQILAAATTYSTPLQIAGNGWYDASGAEAGEIRFNGAATFSGPILLAANSRIAVTSGTGTITGTISGPYQLEVGNAGADGAGTLTLTPATGVNNFATLLISSSINPGISVTTNTVIAGNANALPSTPASLTVNGGQLELNNPTTSFASSFTFANLSGSGGNIGNYGTLAATVTIGSDNSSTTFAGNLINGGSTALNLTKVGTGTLTLLGTNTYTGTTTVSAGALAVQSLSATTAVTVQAGAAFTLYVPSTALTISSLSLGSATVGSTLGFVLNGVSSTAPTITNLTLNAPAAASTISVATSPLLPTNVAIPLFNYTTAIGTAVGSAFTLTLTNSRAAGTLSYSSGQVALTLTSTGAISWAPTGGSTTWDVGSAVGTGGTNNWSINSTETNFINTDDVVFNDSAGAGNGTVNLGVTASPNSVTISNSTVPYTIGGTGTIAGPGNLVMNGAGAATISVPLNISGAVYVIGSGTLTLAAANTYAGGTFLSSGQLNINAGGVAGISSAIGVGPLTITGGTISNTSGTAVTLATNNPQFWGGSFAFGSNNALNLGLGAVTLVNNTTLTFNGSAPLTVGGVISGASKTLSLAGVQSGPGTLIVTATETYTGATTIGSYSTLQVGIGTTIGSVTNSPTITLASNGTLKFFLSTQNVTLPWSHIASATTGSGTIYYQGTNSAATSVASYSALSLTTAFSGTVTVSQARIGAASNATTVVGSTTLFNILAGGQIYLQGTTAAGTGIYTTPIDIAGNGWYDSATVQAGAIRTLANGISYNGPITLTANARISGGTANGNMTINGNISGPYTLDIGNGGTDGFGIITFSPSASVYNSFSGLMISSSVGNTTSTVNTVVAGNQFAFPTTTPASLTMNATTSNASAVLELNSSTSANTGFSFGNLNGSLGTIGNYSPSAAATISFASGSYGGALVNGGAATLALTKTGAGTLTLTEGAANTYSGGTSVQGGTLSFSTGSLSSGPVAFTGTSTLQWNGTNIQDLTSIGGLAINDGVTGTIDTNGNALTFANAIGLGPLQTGALQVVTSLAGGSLSLNGTINFPTLTVGTTGTGALSGGTVNVTGSNGSPGLSTVTLNSGALTLSGSYSSLNAVNVNGGILRVQSGSVGTTAAMAVSNGATLSLFGSSTTSSNTTLNVGSLALGTTAGVNLNFELTGGNPLSAPIVTVGNSGGFTIATGSKTTINFSNTNPSQETVTGATPIILIQYTANSAIPNLTNLFQVGSVPSPGFVANVSTSFSAGIGDVYLNITAVRGSITWTGNQTGGSSPQNGSIWNAGTLPGTGGEFNWTVASTSTNFVNGDSVIFDDSAATTSGTTPPSAGVVTVVGTVSPYLITFNNKALPYTLSGGVIAGTAAGGVTIANGGTVTLTMANTYTGTTALANGQLNLNANGTSTSSPIGAGTLVIGTLGGPAVTIDNTSTGLVTLSTNNVQVWNSNFTFGSTQPLNLGAGAVQLGQSITITLNGANPLTVGGAIGDTVGGVSQGNGLTINGANTGTLILSGISTYTGNTTLNNGTLQLNPTSSLASAAISVASGTTLLFPGLANSGTMTYTSAINGSGAWTLSPQTARSIYAFTGDLSGFAGTINIGAQERFQLQTGGVNNLNSATMINVASGGQFYITIAAGATTGITVGSPISIAGVGVTESGENLGALRLQSISTQSANYAGPITLTANASISSYNSTSFVTGAISGNYQLQMVSSFSPANDAIVLAPGSPNTYASLRVNNTIATSGTSISLIAGNSNAFPVGPSGGGVPLSLAGASATSLAILQLNGINSSFSNLASDNAFAQIQNNNPGSSATITVGSDGSSTTYSGTLIDGGNNPPTLPLSLFKTGSGAVTLTGTSTYTGGTTIDTGTLQLGNGGTTGSISGPITINTGTLAFNLSGSQTFAPAGGISSGSSPGAIVQMGPGSLALSGPNPSFNGSVTVQGGVLRLQSGSVGSGASIAVNDGSTLSIFGLSSTSSSLSVASLALGSAGAGNTFLVELTGSYPTAAAISVTNTNGVTHSGTTTVNVVDTAFPVFGEIPLISYTGTQITAANTWFVTGTLPTQRTQAQFDYSTTGLLQLKVTVPGYITWAPGTTSWDVGTTITMGGTAGSPASGGGTLNWAIAGTTTNFITNDSVLFDDTAGAGHGTVTLAGPVSPSAVTFNNTNVAYSLSGAGGITGSTAVAIIGGGGVSMSTANTYTGGTNLLNGQLNINASGTATSSPIGTGTLTIGTVGGPTVTIDNTSASAVTLATNNAQTWASSFIFGGTSALNLGTGTVTMTNPNMTITVNGTQPLTLGGTINGASQGYGLTLNGTSTGMLSLSGNSTYTGATIINGGTLNYLDGSSLATSPITVNSGGTLLYTMNVAGGNTFLVTINNTIGGAGNWTLSPIPEIMPTTRTRYSFTGNLSGFTGTLTINSTDRFEVSTGFNLGGGAAQIVVNPGGQFYILAPITVTNPITISGNGLAEAAGTLGVIRFQPGTYAGPITLAANAGVSVFNSSGTITGQISGSYQFALISGMLGQSTGTEVLTLAPAAQNTYGSTRVDNSNATVPQNMILKAGNPFAFSSGGLSLAGGLATAPGILELNGFSFSFANLSSNNAFALIENGGTIADTITVGSDGTSTSYSGTLIDGSSGSLALVKTGSGMLTLSGVNSYSGGTTVNGGILQLGASGALGNTGAPLTVNTGSTLDLNGASQTVGSLTGTGGSIVNNAVGTMSTLSVSIGVSNGATYAGVIADHSNPTGGTVALNMNGRGYLILTGLNTYSGGTTVNGGSLVVSSGASLGSGPLIVENLNTTPSSTILGLYDTAQTVGTLSGAIAQPANGDTAAIFLSSATTLTVNQTAPGTFQGTIYGGGSLILGSSSTSTLTLSGNSTYGGSTTINGGTLQLGATGGPAVTNVLPTTTALTLGMGSTLNLNNNNQTIAALNTSAGNINTGSGIGGILTIGNTAGGTVTYSGVISGTGGLTWGIINTNVANPTPSTLLLTSASTSTGPTTINTGTLSIGTAYALSGGVAPVLPYNAAATYPGAFTLGPTATLLTNGFNLTIGSLGGGGPIGGNINLGNNSSSTLYIVVSSPTGYAGVISGTGNVYIANGDSFALYGNWTLTGGVTHDVTTLGANHNDSPQSYLPFATSGSAVTTQGIEFAGFTDQVSTIYGGSSGDNNGKGTFIDATGDAGKLVLSYYAASVANGGPANGLGGTQNFSGFFANDVGLIFDAGYFGNAQQLTLSGPNNTTGPLTIGFTNQTTPQNGAATGAQSGVMNQIIISATSTFGAVTVGNLAVSNLVNNLTVQPTGNLTAASVTIGDAFPGSTGNNSVTVGGTLTTGSVSIGNTNLYGTNVFTILSTGTVKAGGAITIGNDFATGSGTLNINGALGTTSAPVTSLSVQAGGVLTGYGTINTATNPINVTNGTIRGGFDDGVNQLGTLSIAASSGTTAKPALTIQGSGSSGLGQTGGLMTEVLATSSTAATNSKINITGANNALSLNTMSGGAGGAGQINIVLYDPTASLQQGPSSGATYTFVLATLATANKILVGSAPQPAGTVIDTNASGRPTLGAGSGSMGDADLYIIGASQTYMNSVTTWSLFVDSTGKNLVLSVTSTPEPEHILLMCVGVLLAGFAIRRRLHAAHAVC